VTAQAPAKREYGASTPESGIYRTRLPLGSRGQLAWLLAVASLAFFATSQYCRQLYADTYFDLYAGRYIAEHGIPERNVVTVIAHGRPWIDQQWLAQLIFFRAWQLGGYAAVTVLSVTLVSVGIALLGALMLRCGVSPISMCAWTLAALGASYGYATPRAQSFGYLFVPLVLGLVLGNEGRRSPRPVTWLSIPLLVVWANVHGSVVIGAGFVGVHVICRAWRELRRGDWHGVGSYLLLGAGAAVSPVCTPYGFEVIRYYKSLIGNPVLASVGEWAPPKLSAPYAWAFFAVVIAVVAATVVGWRRGNRPQLELAIFAVVTLGQALLAFRNTPWFGFAGCLLAAEMLAGRSAPRTPAASFRRMLAGVLTAIAVVSAISLARAPASQYEASIPRQAVDVTAQLAERQPGIPVLGDQWCAVGLLWLHPALFGRIAFDIRDEEYSPPQLAALLDFLSATGPRWQRLLRGYDLVVVSRSWHPRLAGELQRMPGWRVLFKDDSGVVLERSR
jgi:hypothetical protein